METSEHLASSLRIHYGGCIRDRHRRPVRAHAHAAGKLSIGLWDHWVPSANAASKALIEEWAAKEKVEVQIDYITSQGRSC